jgi:hypothetical protein
MRYLVFGGQVYYPAGGMDDLKDRFDDLDSALQLCRDLRTPDKWGYAPCDWTHIYDVQDDKILYLSDFD